MTVIAWDGKTLAADRRATLGTLIREKRKVFRAHSPQWGIVLAAYAGDADAGEEVLEWFKNGAIPKDFPPLQRDKDSWAGLLIVMPDGHLWKYERSPQPLEFPPQHFALGSGRDFALMAMHLGKTAAEAVELTSLFDSGCGNGVDTLSYADQA